MWASRQKDPSGAVDLRDGRTYSGGPIAERHAGCGSWHAMSLSLEIRRHREAFHIGHEPTCDRCGHGASLHTLSERTPCIGCGERLAAGGLPRPACLGFASEWFDNSRARRVAVG